MFGSFGLSSASTALSVATFGSSSAAAFCLLGSLSASMALSAVAFGFLSAAAFRLLGSLSALTALSATAFGIRLSCLHQTIPKDLSGTPKFC